MTTFTGAGRHSAIAGLGLLLASNAAHALLISPTGNTTGNPAQATYSVSFDTGDVGKSFTFDWLVPQGTPGDSGALLPVDLSAHGVFTIEKFAMNVNNNVLNDTLTLKLKLTNTTDLSLYPNEKAAIYSFGLGSDSTFGATATTSTHFAVGSGAGPQQTFPGGFKDIDICAYGYSLDPNSNNECGGGDINDGLQAGGFDIWTLYVDGDFDQGGNAPGSLTLNDFPMKFQTSWGSFSVPGQPPRHQQVPAPGTLALFAASLLGLRLGSRRRRKAC